MTISQLCTEARRELERKFAPGEAQALVRETMKRLKGYSAVDLVVNGDKEASDFIETKVREVTKRLLNNEPIQYIFGRAYFYGLDFTVTPDVLIPRPETAELVDFIVKRYSGKTDLRVLDICTGSGCIACALGRNLPFSEVTAIDISPQALDVARHNAADLKVKVKFEQADIFALAPPERACFDIIVSNPPYIADSERQLMDANVIDHEPHLALFVPDDNPIAFYRVISGYALKALCPGGTIWFEINPLYAASLVEMMESAGWEDVTLDRDTSDHLRFLTATLPL